MAETTVVPPHAAVPGMVPLAGPPAAPVAVPAAPLLTVPAVTPVPERVVYAASAARGTIFSLLFLLLLPFFASIPAMLYMRISHGLVSDTLGLTILGLGFAVVMFLILVELLYSIRTRVDLGDKAVKMTLPAGAGPTPMLRYVSHEVPYDQIKAIETRREIYGGRLAPVLMRGARIVTKDGKAIRLGYINEANVDPALPIHEIAAQIASRAGVPIVDRGNVRRRVTNKMLGIAAAPGAANTIEERDIELLNRGHARVMVALIAGLTLLVGIGIAADLTAEDTTQASALAGPAVKAKGAKALK